MSSKILKRLAWVPGLLLCAGCGIGIQISGSPGTAAPGQPVTFHFALTNHAVCPAESVVLVAVFRTDQEITSGSSSGVGQGFIDLFCNGAINSDGQHCSLDGDTITCNFPIPTVGPFAPIAPTQQGFLLTPPGLPEPIPCTASPGTIQCQIPAADRQAFSFQNLHPPAGPLSPTGPGICISAPPPFDGVCFVPPLNAGDTTSFDVTLTSPLTPGTFRTLAFVPQTDGVCQGGTDPGQPCSTLDTSSPCGAGTCQPSICTSGTNTGDGCAVNGDCGAGGACQACYAQGGETLATTLGCATTNVSPPAPAASRTGLLMIAVVLFGLGAFLLRRHQRPTP